MYFFPVSELLAVTVTPGSGVLPAFTLPAISPKGDATAAADCAVAAGGAAGTACATPLDPALSRRAKIGSPRGRWPRNSFFVAINFSAERTAEVSPLPGFRHCADGRHSAGSARTSRF